MSENSPIPFTARLFSGSDKGLDFRIPQAEGITSSWTLSWTVYDDEAKGLQLMHKTSADDITVQDDPSGTFRVRLSADDWDLVPPGSYYYELWREDASTKDNLAYGAMEVR